MREHAGGKDSMDVPPRFLARRPHYVNVRRPRIEDDRLLRGTASYIADLRLAETVDMAVVRSGLAHALIRAVNLEPARTAAGVVAVASADGLSDVSPFPDFFDDVNPVGLFPLCRERVRYVGAPIAAIVAEDRYLAEDALELAEIDLEELPVVASIESALANNAPRLYDEWTDNRLVSAQVVNPDVEAWLPRGQVVRETYRIQRHTAMPIETRGSLAIYDGDRLTLWTSTQNPHITRTTLSYVLPLAERNIRVIAPDVGGAFGCKQHIYPEDVLVAWFAMRLRRPVRFIEDRSEHMVSTNHARDEEIRMEAAVDDAGQILALRAHVIQDVGSGEIFTPGFSPSFVTAGHLTGAYRIPAAEVSVTCVVTNKTPSGAFRGYGIPEAVFALERFVEKIAKEKNVDPLELRRRMLISGAELPYVSPLGGVLDSGSFEESFERAVELGTEAEERGRLRWRAAQDIRVGVGYATYVEGTAGSHYGTSSHWTSHDACSLRVEPDGSVVVSLGVTTQGQGVSTMAATLTADALGVPIESVGVVMGDTDLCPYGLGAWGSRSTPIGGGAILRAATTLRGKILRVAAFALEADPDDLVIGDGTIAIRGSDRRVELATIATAAWIRTQDLPPGELPGLESRATYDPPGLDHVPDELGRMNGAAAWANATHAAVVAVDIETGDVTLLDYIVVHDCGRVINPQIVEGQIHGGVVHGIGGTLYESLPYDSSGQPLGAGLMDYLIPSAAETPSMTVEHFESPSPVIPLGMKGVGEGGTIGAPAAITNAVAKALVEFEVDASATPLTPTEIRRQIRVNQASRT